MTKKGRAGGEDCAVPEGAVQDWANEVFFHADISPIFQEHVKTLDTELALRRICKQAPAAVVFKPQEACELLKKHGFTKSAGLAAHAARDGDLFLLQFAIRRAATPSTSAKPRLGKAIWRYLSGRTRTSARGTRTRARTWRWAATSRCSSGCTRKLPVGRVHVRVRGSGRPPRVPQVGARARLPLGRVDVRSRGQGRPPRVPQVVAQARLPVEHVHVRVGGQGRPLRDPQVGARAGLPMGRVHVRLRC